MASEVPIIIESNLVEEDGMALFMAADLNLVCTYRFGDGEVDIIGSIPCDSMLKKRCCKKILTWGDRYVFIPFNMKQIAVFDRGSGNWECIAIENEGTPRKFICAEICCGNLYLFGNYYPAILKVNLETYEVEYIDDWLDGSLKAPYFGAASARVQDEAYVPLHGTRNVMKMNLQTARWEWLEVPVKEQGFVAIAYANGSFWVAPRKGRSVIQWDGKGHAKVYRVGTDQGGADYYTGNYAMGNQVMFVTSLKNEIEWATEAGIKTQNVSAPILYCGKLNGNRFYWINKNGGIEMVDRSGNVKETIQCKAKYERIESLLKGGHFSFEDFGQLKQPGHETELFGLRLFLDCVPRVSREGAKGAGNAPNIGNGIFAQLYAQIMP